MPLTPESQAFQDIITTNLEAGRQPIILSDFDYTLCHDYTYNKDSNNHTPMINDGVISQTDGIELVIATSRRAVNPAIDAIWASGIISTSQPIIAENGGTILSNSSTGERVAADQVHPDQISQIDEVVDTLLRQEMELPDGHEFIAKRGRTMAILRIQNMMGRVSAEGQIALTDSIKQLIEGSNLCVVNNRISLSLQHESTDKADAFRTYIKSTDRLREDLFVIGMGDGLNDAEIFAEADLSIGFGEVVKHLVDVSLPTTSLDNTLLALGGIRKAIGLSD